MKKGLFFVAVFLCFSGFSENTNSPKRASFLEIFAAHGNVFSTNDFVKDIPRYNAFSLRYAQASNGSTWKDIAYNMPFFGVGFYMPFFADNPGLGNPFSIYVFRGNTLAQFTDHLGLILELNLGLSMNWNPHDIFDNPNNEAIGSSSNAHVGLRLLLDYNFAKHFDLKFGIDLNHFSNGNIRMPNKGVNIGALSLSLAYNFNPANKGFVLRNSDLRPPEIPFHINHEMQFIFSNRQTMFDREGTNLTSAYVDRNFTVLGLAYSPTFAKGYKYRWGPSIQFIYDESSNVKGHLNDDGHVVVQIADFSDRLSLGLGLRGEISMPVVSIFATLGYNVLHNHHFDNPFYQTIGVKAYLKDNLFASFGINAMQFTVAKFLSWGLGYTF
jgi:hypothetical protein